MNLLKHVFVFLLVPLCLLGQTNNKLIDSILILRNLSTDVSISEKERFDYALKSYSLSNQTNIDSTMARSTLNLAYTYLLTGDYENYRKYSHKTLKLSETTKDTLMIVKANHYLGYYYHNNTQNDSAYYYYYRAQNLYRYLNKPVDEAYVLQNMANIQESEKDYVGCEKNAITAIKLLQKAEQNDENYKSLWALNNILAVISERLERRDEAISYYNKSIEISKKINNGKIYYLNTINNLAYTIEGQGNLKRALEFYEELANDKQLYEIDTKLYVIAIGNVARLKFVLNPEHAQESKKILFNAIRISDSLDDTINEMGNYGFLADIYNKTSLRDSAIFYSKKLLEFATITNSNSERLQALKLLGELELGKTATQYLSNHIRLSDSLLKNERKARDKFTRIEFETDQIIAEKEQISKERLIFLLSSIGLFVAVLLIIIIINQRSKNKQLRFNQIQQEANENIYNLMIDQQNKLEEGRTQEKKRISKELHDGVLGKLFGTRLNLDSLNTKTTTEAMETRDKYLKGLKDVEEEIRKISHDLSNDFVSESNFVDIMETLIETQAQAYGLNFSFDNNTSINWELFPNKTKIHIYRIVQESLQNIYKHANATTTKISFKLKNNVIFIAIEDDGNGFNVSKARKGIGLKNIQSRVKDMKGELKISSQINSGSSFEIMIPQEKTV
ncbi:tetratricopeptide repeat protein [Flavobacteriaceae bacterium]|nr:tetratricopeptide repeat protein [Bacteroidota bacterium]MDA9551555.1 tetratricopeptide repeat protein [Flavobacteriaceae bacterium]MDC0956491.1 tetratricopeptide repeat protein [Flavobacteriaceae bacterium]